MNPTTYKINPAPGYLVVEPISVDQFNETGLATLEDEKERIATGRVLSVGDWDIEAVKVLADLASNIRSEEYKLNYPNVEEGDIVAYQPYTENQIKLNGKELHLIRFDKITGVIEEVK